MIIRRIMERTVKKVHYHRSQGVPIRGVLFDMDGTLTIPAIDFTGLRAKINVPRPLDILVEVSKLESPQREWAMKVIEEFEADGRSRFALQPGCNELFSFLDDHKLPRGLLTRNNREAIDHMLQMTGFKFDVELARDFLPVKPAPDGALHFASKVGLETHHCIFVGDSEEDMECGRRAGMVTILLDHGYAKPDESHVDIRIKSLHDLVTLIHDGFHVERDEHWPHHARRD